MAWRFKASKYKNAAPIIPKPENYVRDISVGSYQTYGNNITASAKFMAFNWDHNGSSLAVLPLDDSGRKSKSMPLLHAHTDTVTDLEFSPFHDGLLATGSQDCTVKVWSIPEEGLQESLTNPECTFSHKQRRVETVGFHPTADFFLYSTSYTTLTLWDLMTEQEIFSNGDHSEVIQSVSWKKDGTLLATSCKDKQVRILDPRIDNSCIKTANSHQSIKDSRVVWLGDNNKILTTGFDAQRLRQVIIRDLRNFNEVEKSLELNCSTGILIPLYDADTGMLFLAGKGDTTIGYMEVTDKEPYLIEGIRHSGEQTKGACLVPKRALNVMQGEVNRVLQLTSSSVIPVTYQVPRKTYRDFHADLYPETTGFKTELTAAQWFQGKNVTVPKISLNPADRENGETSTTVYRGSLLDMKEQYKKTRTETESVPTTFQPKITAIINKTVKSMSKSIDNDKQIHVTIDEKTDFKNDKEYFENIENADVENDQNIENEQKVHAVNQQKIDSEIEPNIENDQTLGFEKDIQLNLEIEYVDDVLNESDVVSKEDKIVPPKPLPRTSRAGSMCEPLEDLINQPKPIARPRTNSCVPVVTSVNPNMPISGGYKPRLGPKPFTPPKLNDSESFDKIFSVPPVPGQQHSQINGTNDLKETNGDVNSTLDQSPVVQEKEKSPTSDGEVPTIKVDNEASKSDTSGEEETSGDSGYIPKTPTTAERRRLFETRSNSKENETEENLDSIDQGNFERASLQRSSIAERRKLYENRSQSMQETPSIIVEGSAASSPVPLRRKDSLKNRKNGNEVTKENSRKSIPMKQQSVDPQSTRKSEIITAPTPKRTSTVFGRVSKFRHLQGTPAHKSQQIENIRNVSRQISGECDGFHANSEYVAVPLSGPGGKISIFKRNKPGKLPDGVIPALVHGSNIMDFCWDPFDSSRLAVACDDGVIKLWKIPEGGLVEPTNEPDSEFNAHSDKIYFIKFHPTAQNVLASGSYDMTIKIWDLEDRIEKIVLKGHVDQIFSFSWSSCGIFCSTISKDGKIRVYKPRQSDTPIREGKGPAGTRGARIVWALDSNFIVVTGFDKVSERQIMAFKATDLNNPLNTIGLDVSPAILIPYYDEDSSTLFLTGRGDSTIYAFEITEESPYICPLSHHRCNSLHQGLSFLPKNICDVANVEFAAALRLTNNTIEPLSFTVPRIKTELFQDDLFPPTRVTWIPSLSSSEWFNGKDKAPTRVSLKPSGMDSLSESQGQPNPTDRTLNKSASTPFIGASQPINRLAWNSELSDQTKIKQNEIQKSVSSRLEVNLKLEQDEMEGVDEIEWHE